jgi:hypothetical protein
MLTTCPVTFGGTTLAGCVLEGDVGSTRPQLLVATIATAINTKTHPRFIRSLQFNVPRQQSSLPPGILKSPIL